MFNSDDPCTWYTQDDATKAARLLLARCQQAIKENTTRATTAWQYSQIYEGAVSLSPVTAASVPGELLRRLPETTIIRNRVRSLVQTWVSKVTAGDSPLPQFMTTGGDWETRMRAVAWDRAVEAEINRPHGVYVDAHELWRHAATKAAVIGSVAVYFGLGPDGAPCLEIDDTLAMGVDASRPDAAPQAIVTTRCLSVDDAEALYGERVRLEANAETSNSAAEGGEIISEQSMYGRQVTRTFVRLHCGWARGENGRYMVVLNDGTALVDEEYEREDLPFVFFHYERELFGQWGVSLVQAVYLSCVRENEMLNDVHAAERNTAQVYVMGHESQVDPAALTNVTGVAWIPLKDAAVANPPAFVAPPKFNRQSLELVQLEASEAHNISGISEAHASARKSIGTGSGRHEALVAALFTERFADHERRLLYARTVATARQLVWRLQDAIDGGYEYERTWRSKTGKRRLKLAADDLDFELDHEIVIKPVSEDKNSPAARQKQLQEWLDAGKITWGEFMQGQQHLDTIAMSELATSNEQWINDQIEGWLYDKHVDYQSPVKWNDQQASIAQVANAYNIARSEGAPPERLEFFENFMAECQIYVDQEGLAGAATTSPSAVGPQGLAAAFPGAFPGGAPAPAPGAPASPLAPAAQPAALPAVPAL